MINFSENKQAQSALDVVSGDEDTHFKIKLTKLFESETERERVLDLDWA